METFFSLLSSLGLPGGFLVGAAIGLVLSLLFYWIAPQGVDTISAGTWSIVICGVVGMFWPLILRKKKK